MALLVDYSQTKYGIPYKGAYVRVVNFSVGKPSVKQDGTPTDTYINVVYHVFASKDAALAGADTLYVAQENIPFDVKDAVSFASIYKALKPTFEKAKDV